MCIIKIIIYFKKIKQDQISYLCGIVGCTSILCIRVNYMIVLLSTHICTLGLALLRHGEYKLFSRLYDVHWIINY